MRTQRAAAAALFAAGSSRAQVARRLGIAKSTASEWYRRWSESGAIAPRARGPRPRLTPADLERLAAAMLRPPHAAGFDLERWSLAAVALWIERETGVRYHRRALARVLARAGFVVPPVGPQAGRALRALAMRDPEGNEVRLYQRSLQRGSRT